MLAGGVTTITVSDLENADIEKGDPNATVEYTTVAMNFKAQPNDPFKEYQARTAAGMNRMDKIRDGFSNQDKWGGYDGIKPNSYISTNTSGFWRTGRWHDRIVMVDPDGNVAVLRGMNYLLPEPMCASSTPTTQAIFEAKYKDMNVWAADAASMLHGVGFNMYMVGPSIARDYRFQSRSGYGVTEAMDEIMHNPSQGNCLSQVEWLNFLIQFWWDYKNLYDLMINNSCTEPTALATGGHDPANQFSTGQACFFLTGSWDYTGLSAAQPSVKMLPYYCGVAGEEKAGLNCGTENCWAINANASDADKQATMDFMVWLVSDPEASGALVEQLGILPYKNAAPSTNGFLNDAAAYTDNGCYVMDWATNYQPNVDQYRAALVSALNAYNADQSDANWAAVKTAFVDGWATQWAAANA